MPRAASHTIILALTLLAAGAARAESLIAGARTDVPASANPGHRSIIDGETLRVMSAITGVEFHVPGVISSAPGGLSPVPIPIRKHVNGVEYWFVSGELSGYTTDEWGMHIVVGPIDA